MGRVRVTDVLEIPTLSRNNAKVRLQVIDRMKGEKDNTLQLVYSEPYSGPGMNPDDVVIQIGSEQHWREMVGKEFFVFLNKTEDGSYVTHYGYYFEIVDGKLPYLPREYWEFCKLEQNPKAAEFIARVRTKDLGYNVQVGEPLLPTPFRKHLRRMDTPRESIERLRGVILENRITEAEQSLYKTQSYLRPKFVRSFTDAEQAELKKLKVTKEAVFGDCAIVAINAEGGTSAPDLWYLIREKTRWQFLNPEPSTDEEREEIKKLKAGEAFSVLLFTLKKQGL